MTKKNDTDVIVNRLKVTTEEVTTILQNLKPSSAPICMVGETGIGKTALVTQVFGPSFKTKQPINKENKPKHVVLKFPPLAQLLPEDFTGIPKERDGYYFYAPPEWVAKAFRAAEEFNVPLVIFLDEINRADKEIQNSLLALIDESGGRLGSLDLPDNTIIVAARNPSTYRNTVAMDEALQKRLREVEVSPDVEGWLTWATIFGIDPLIIGFVHKFGMPVLHDIPKDADPNIPHPYPRGWKMVNDTFREHHPQTREGIFKKIASNIIGEPHINQLLLYIRQAGNLPDPVGVLLGKEKLPKEIDVQLIIMRSIAQLLIQQPERYWRAFFDRKSPSHDWPIEVMVGTIVAPIFRSKALSRVGLEMGDDAVIKETGWQEHPVLPFLDYTNAFSL